MPKPKTHPLEVAAHIEAATERDGFAEPAVPGTRNALPVRALPTQLRRPNRATIRTVFQALVALCAMAPVLVATTGLKSDQLPWLAGVLAAAAAVTRVMALPQVETFLRRFLPWLAAAPKPKL
jgi:hypothetical protein